MHERPEFGIYLKETAPFVSFMKDFSIASAELINPELAKPSEDRVTVFLSNHGSFIAPFPAPILTLDYLLERPEANARAHFDGLRGTPGYTEDVAALETAYNHLDYKMKQLQKIENSSVVSGKAPPKLGKGGDGLASKDEGGQKDYDRELPLELQEFCLESFTEGFGPAQHLFIQEIQDFEARPAGNGIP